MQSWKPRRPSESIEHSLYGVPASTRPAMLVPALSMRWLAPAALCLMAGFALLQQDVRHGTETNPFESSITLSSSNRHAGEFLRAFSNNSSGSFEWTNHSGSTSSIGSFLPGTVN